MASLPGTTIPSLGEPPMEGWRGPSVTISLLGLLKPGLLSPTLKVAGSVDLGENVHI